MDDSEDLEEMGKLVDALRKGFSNCHNCPLSYDYTSLDECTLIYRSLSGVIDCARIRNRKADEVVRYILERSLRDEG